MIEIDDEKKLIALYNKQMGTEIDGESLGTEFKGYVFRISGGNDKQGFPMKQGVLVPGRVRLLLSKGHSCYRARKQGERKRKSVHGCIVGSDIAVCNLVVVRAGEQPIDKVTDVNIPKRLGPKRASKIRKLFNLKKEDDVTKFVVRRKYTNKAGKVKNKAPKIQRLVTSVTIQRRKAMKKDEEERHKRVKEEAVEYEKLKQKRLQEKKERRASEIAKRRSRESRESQQSQEKAVAASAPATKAAAPTKVAAPQPKAPSATTKAPAAAAKEEKKTKGGKQ